jgi:tetratricopeptide (TPR) repeat protein
MMPAADGGRRCRRRRRRRHTPLLAPLLLLATCIAGAGVGAEADEAEQLAQASALHAEALAAEETSPRHAASLYARAARLRPVQWESTLRLGTLLLREGSGWGVEGEGGRRRRLAEAEQALRYTVGRAARRRGVDVCAARTNLGVLLAKRAAEYDGDVSGSGGGDGDDDSDDDHHDDALAAAAMSRGAALRRSAEALQQYEAAAAAAGAVGAAHHSAEGGGGGAGDGGGARPRSGCPAARLNAARLLTQIAAVAPPVPAGQWRAKAMGTGAGGTLGVLGEGPTSMRLRAAQHYAALLRDEVWQREPGNADAASLGLHVLLHASSIIVRRGAQKRLSGSSSAASGGLNSGGAQGEQQQEEEEEEEGLGCEEPLTQFVAGLGADALALLGRAALSAGDTRAAAAHTAASLAASLSRESAEPRLQPKLVLKKPTESQSPQRLQMSIIESSSSTPSPPLTGHPVAHATHGLLAEKAGHLEEAVAAFRTAVRAASMYGAAPDAAGTGGPTRAAHSAYNNLGNMLQATGRVPEALGAYDDALGLRPADAEAWNNRAVALYVCARQSLCPPPPPPAHTHPPTLTSERPALTGISACIYTHCRQESEEAGRPPRHTHWCVFQVCVPSAAVRSCLLVRSGPRPAPRLCASLWGADVHQDLHLRLARPRRRPRHAAPLHARLAERGWAAGAAALASAGVSAPPAADAYHRGSPRAARGGGARLGAGAAGRRGGSSGRR